jgi:S-adenosylmethionine:tRNA ribosyltransferase-isomerase
MNVADFDYDLPPELIAQFPPPERGQSRLLVLERATGSLTHAAVQDLPHLLRPADLLVVNDTKVFPARLLGVREPGGGAVECLLLWRVDDDYWEALVHPGQRLKPGRRLRFERGEVVLHAEVVEQHFFGRRLLRLWTGSSLPITAAIARVGHTPLPPYIKRPDLELDRERYQTVFAREQGSVAAPTAGLHFTPDLLAALSAAGIEQAAITLHVGYGTFQPVRVVKVEEHQVQPERFSISKSAAEVINAALSSRRRIVAVGTTTTRALETAVARANGVIQPGEGETDLFIYPGYRFRVIGALFTNLHLPRSSLLMLVAAFGGREAVLAAYAEAVKAQYRFYSYGDAMLIL